jgi:hypothetical protein
MNGFRIFCTVRTSIAANEARSVFKRSIPPDLIRKPPDLIRKPAPDLIRDEGRFASRKRVKSRIQGPVSILSKRKRLAGLMRPEKS